jgi:hypothetical protein
MRFSFGDSGEFLDSNQLFVNCPSVKPEQSDSAQRRELFPSEAFYVWSKLNIGFPLIAEGHLRGCRVQEASAEGAIVEEISPQY